eukprot:jgi/Galph1/5830/GphlegSOOS_G4505.1
MTTNIKKRWIPLESNPQVLTSFIHKLGVEGDTCLVDVLSPELLDLVPRPVYAVILLYPLNSKADQMEKNMQPSNLESTTNVYFCKQTISNACGTVALLHAILNNVQRVALKENSFLKQFYQQSLPLSPDDRAKLLEQSEELDAVHHTFAQSGQSEAPCSDDELDLHFITFVCSGNKLVQLDGRLDQPVVYGDCSDNDDLLKEATKVIQEGFMAVDPDEVRFTMLALV